jgi:hypothetical protein
MATVSDAMRSPEWDRVWARINAQAATILAGLGTQITERAFTTLTASPQWERASARINAQAATILAGLGTQITERAFTTLTASPEWERVIELATTVATTAAQPSPPTDPPVPPAAVTATVFIAVYALLLTFYFNAFERTSDHLLAGNYVERLEFMGTLAGIALAIAHRCTPKP